MCKYNNGEKFYCRKSMQAVGKELIINELWPYVVTCVAQTIGSLQFNYYTKLTKKIPQPSNMHYALKIAVDKVNIARFKV